MAILDLLYRVHNLVKWKRKIGEEKEERSVERQHFDGRSSYLKALLAREYEACMVDMKIERWSGDSREGLGLELFFSYNALLACTSVLLLSFAMLWRVKAVWLSEGELNLINRISGYENFYTTLSVVYDYITIA